MILVSSIIITRVNAVSTTDMRLDDEQYTCPLAFGMITGWVIPVGEHAEAGCKSRTRPELEDDSLLLLVTFYHLENDFILERL